MKISEIQIIPIKPQKGLLGFASFVVNDEFYFSSIGIHQKLNGDLRLTYPTKNGINLFHPLKSEVSKQIETEIFAKFKNVMNLKNDRYNRSHTSTK